MDQIAEQGGKVVGSEILREVVRSVSPAQNMDSGGEVASPIGSPSTIEILEEMVQMASARHFFQW
jgi:hypothetical protein